ncbi:MAG TPA: TIGR03084 family metal-binding protein [Acidimicrobiales bacterium]|nr:TIGR03084 family metal-binding protein [Acidimicrobiales bacterium]
MTTLPELLADLEDEFADLRRMVTPLSARAPEWDRATPAEGWAVRDQISHLAFFDDAGRMAMVAPDEFAQGAALAMEQTGDPMEAHLVMGRAMDGVELLAWWDTAHRGMAEAFAGADPAARVPWYGPPMGVLSFVSARLMETWAHGQDVADALGVERRPTDRLRHVAHLGVRARPFSYLVRSREAPPGRIDVVLAAPTGEPWRWQVGEVADDGAAGHTPASVVRGPALDFCLVVTQRRNLADTALVVEGDAAAEWMSLAQAFAGPPGPGRPPLASTG